MEENLVTVAIHTYDRAIIIKGILESEGIDVFLQNVNLIQPVIAAGVRIRIKESDLTTALMILEKLNFSDEESVKEEQVEKKSILVPVDFSDYSLKAARIAFYLAKDTDSHIVLLHTYYSPFYSGGMPISDAFAFDEGHEEAMRILIKKMHEKMDELSNALNDDIKSCKIPDIQFVTKFREGVPEEQILNYSRKHHSLVTIMGTHGLGSKEGDLMGSVTVEVMERSRVPVFAFPENLPFGKLSDIKTIGFITNFEQRDLIAFESMMQLLKSYQFKVYFIHLSSDPEKWDEIKLSGIKEYFGKLYPGIECSYCMIRGDQLIDELNDFIMERNIDMIAMPAQKRSIFSRLFNASLATKMLFHSKTPVLVLRG
ncbi:MAG: universal stress protein [Bacteroidota bacterium]|nr:universal stress protein [Bacteroidota bacterium]